MVNTIDDVIAALDAIVSNSLRDADRLGYFAALYRRVTRAVKAGLAAGRFTDPASLERLDVVFARRYLDALYAFRAGQPVCRCWRAAFNGASLSTPLVLQHLLAGMNAHINFDLGIATAQVNPAQSDFDEINTVLAEQVGVVQDELAEVSPLLKSIEAIDPGDETVVINFSLAKARDFAWLASERLRAAQPAVAPLAIDGLDLAVRALGLAVLNPLPAVALRLAPVRAVESNDVRAILNILARP